MRSHLLISTLIVTLSLAGCGAPTQEPQKGASTAHTAPPLATSSKDSSSRHEGSSILSRQQHAATPVQEITPSAPMPASHTNAPMKATSTMPEQPNAPLNAGTPLPNSRSAANAEWAEKVRNSKFIVEFNAQAPQDLSLIHI